jgi:antitoxin component of MazEF toxin-antitoxin module
MEYSQPVQTKTILINGKKAVPIPDTILAQCPLGDNVDVSVVQGGVLVKPTERQSRAGWAEALAKIPQESLDHDFDDLRAVRETGDSFGDKDWQW